MSGYDYDTYPVAATHLHSGRSRHSQHQQVLAPPDATWPCPVCTFENPSLKTKCELCLTPKPSNSPQAVILRNHKQHIPQQPMHISVDSAVLSKPKPPKPKRISSQQSTLHLNAHLPSINRLLSKPIAQQTILERWMVAQMERKKGQQPTICNANNVILTNLHRLRAPTTQETLQRQIDLTMSMNIHSNHLAAGDFTDDEEEDFSAQLSPQNSPRSPSSTYGDLDTPSSGFTLSPRGYGSNYAHGGFPAAHGGFGNGNGAKASKVSKHSKQSQSVSHPALPALPALSGKSASHDDIEEAESFKYNHKRRLNSRRRKRTDRRHQTVAQLWMKAQAQLRQGKQPTITAKFGIQLDNVRQHNPRFKEFQRRRSHHEKAANYLHTHTLGQERDAHARKGIDHDDEDEDEEDSESVNYAANAAMSDMV